MISRKIKIITLSLGAICLLGIGSYGLESMYKYYQVKHIEQVKEQHKKEQIDEAKNNISNVVNSKIANLQCKANYDYTDSSNDSASIKVTLDGTKDTTIQCDFKLTDDSTVFENQDYFNFHSRGLNPPSLDGISF